MLLNIKTGDILNNYIKLKKVLFSGFLSINLILSLSLNAYADKFTDAMEERRSWPVKSNEIENWPEGPAVGAASAILLEAETGIILYEKNVDEKMFPASTTKLMTCMLAMEKEGSSLKDMVSFSYDAVHSVTPDASNMGMDAGEAMTLEDCLYGIMVLSANEVCNAVAEYTSGSVDSFVDLMNERAESIGCKNTHFNNAHGYTDPDHYTSAYDLALIAREFFKNEFLAKVSRTCTYHWYPTDTQPDDIWLSSKNQFLNKTYSLEGLIGSKTGFTDESRQVLVTGAERNGITLICVVMEEETPYQYIDSLALFNYGFNNFTRIKVADNETKYDMKNESFFVTGYDVFGDSSSFISLDPDSEIILPKNCEFTDLDSKLIYKDDDESVLADIEYSYNGKYLGNAGLIVEKDNKTSFIFGDTNEFIEETEDNDTTFIYVNNIIKVVAIIVGILFVYLIIRRIFSAFHFSGRRHYYVKPRKRKKRKRFNEDD